ncbi:hypothetical protein B5S28_g4256 [[Candida] boidinii]|nr:hypothetical protein B5S28_g4256 [[Candida] boidinii]OWB63739.1 hypothetical protein B5S29_g4745 [[Candida] boidinii]OWB74448.1 hypothetical protein B5S31_g4242 [[Candida] boidinii]OWB81041.1 hypothetical protein B5S32_g5385 [[Candida] boidinii]
MSTDLSSSDTKMSTDSTTANESGTKINADDNTGANNVNPEVATNENNNKNNNNSNSSNDNQTRNIDTYEGFFRTAFVKDFHPVWNVAYMSTGLAACVLFGFPYEATWLRICGLIMWSISMILFLVVNWLFIHKALVYKSWIKTVFTDPTLNVFLAPYSMGFSTTVNMIHLVTVHYKHDFAIGTMVFWWINAFMAIIIAWAVLFILFSYKDIEYKGLNPTIVLASLPLTVCASSGALITSTLQDKNLKLTVMIISFLLWSNSILIGSLFIGIVFWKLLTSGLPPKMLTLTSFIPIGFLGHGAWGILLNGLNIEEYLILYTDIPDKAAIGKGLQLITLAIALFFIAAGFFFTFFSFAAWIKVGHISLNKGYWAAPFPLGALTLALNEFYKSSGIKVFRDIASIYGALAVVLTILCIFITLFFEFPHDQVRLRLSRKKPSDMV